MQKDSCIEMCLERCDGTSRENYVFKREYKLLQSENRQTKK